jgi:hypothetical protein
VVSEQRIMVLDTSSPSREVLWHVDDLDGQIFTAGFFSQREVYLVHGPDGWRDWSYAIPSRRLLARTDFKVNEDLPLLAHPAFVALQPEVQIVNGRAELRYWQGGVERECVLREMPAEPGFSTHFDALDRGLVVALYFNTHIDYFVVAIPENLLVARVNWPRATPAQVREHAGQILFYDGEGRLLHLNADDSTSRHLSVR